MEPEMSPAEADVIAGIIINTAHALSRRAGPTPARREARGDEVVAMIEAMRPGNVIEAMLASHCAIFHYLLDEAVPDAQVGVVADSGQHGVPAGLVALNNAFHRNLDRLRRERKAAADEAKARARTARAGGPVAAPAETGTRMPPSHRPAGETASTPGQDGRHQADMRGDGTRGDGTRGDGTREAVPAQPPAAGPATAAPGQVGAAAASHPAAPVAARASVSAAAPAGAVPDRRPDPLATPRARNGAAAL